MPGALHTRSLACSKSSTRVRHHRYAEHSGIPCAMVLRLIRDLPGVPGLIASIPPGLFSVSAARPTSLDPGG
jgi:hypothetical protein